MGSRVIAVVIVVALLASLPAFGVSSPAAAQEGTENYTSPETVSLSGELEQLQNRMDELQAEEDQMVNSDNPDDYDSARLTEINEEQGQIQDQIDSTAEGLALARLEAIQQAPVSGSTEEQIAALEQKRSSLEALESWANDNAGAFQDSDASLAVREELDANESRIAELQLEGESQGQESQGQESGGEAGDQGAAPADPQQADQGSGAGGWLWSRLWPILLLLVVVAGLGLLILAPIAHLMGGSVFGTLVGFGARFGFRRYFARRAMSTGLHNYDPDAIGAKVRISEEAVDVRGHGWIFDTPGIWTVEGKTYDVPHIGAHAATGIGKNQTLVNAAWWNIMHCRPESGVITDPKGDAVEEFLDHAPEGVRQFVYSFEPSHETSSALNVVETPRMAAQTAAALWDVEDSDRKIFPQGARDLFEALADALGYSETSLGEIYQVLSDPDVLESLKKRHSGVKAAIGGANEKFAGDVVSTARLALAPLKQEEVARVFSPEPNAPQPHFQEKEIVYICTPLTGDFTKKLAGALMANLVDRAAEAKTGVYFVVDEAGTVCTPGKAKDYLGMGRGLKTYFWLIFQDIAQLEAALTKPQSRSVLGNMRAQFFGQTQEPSTANYISELSGHVRVGRRTPHEEPNIFNRTARLFGAKQEYHYSTEWRERVRPEDEYNLPPGSWIVWSGNAEDIEVLHAQYWYTYSHLLLGPSVPPNLLGIPREPQEERRRAPGGDTESGESGTRRPPGEPPPRPEGEGSRRPPRGEGGDPEGSGGAEGQTQAPPRNANSEDRFCPSCGMLVGGPGAKFCASCGGRL